MARSFNGSSDNLFYNGAVVSSPFSLGVVGWFKPTTTGGNGDMIWWAGRSDINDTLNSFRLDSSSKIVWQQRDDNSNNNGVAVTSGSYTLNAWNFAAAASVAANNRKVWVNGAGAGTDSTSVGTITTNNTAIGKSQRTSPGNFFNGALSHVAVWDLTGWGANASARLAAFDAAQADMASGTHPGTYTTGLIGLWLLDGAGGLVLELDDSPSGADMTITGTSLVSGPPVNPIGGGGVAIPIFMHHYQMQGAA